MAKWLTCPAIVAGLLLFSVVEAHRHHHHRHRRHDDDEADKTSILMPGAVVDAPDTYLCTAVKLDPEQPIYITEFVPHATMMKSHHMLLYGCTEPGSQDKIWNCGEMMSSSNGAKRSYKSAGVCAGGQSIVYAWGRDAPELVLPKGVGFKVGGDTGINYLVAQLHYMHASKTPDNSGLDVISTKTEQPKRAAVFLLGTSGKMGPKSTEDFEVACPIDQDVEMHPFAFRTHAHEHAKVISDWRVTKDEQGDKWELIGKHDPHCAQMFYPVEDKSMVIKRGDTLAARCHMKNDGDKTVHIGSRGSDEMCNFYMMYWTDKEHLLENNQCWSAGPPSQYWEDEGLTNIPDEEANKL